MADPSLDGSEVQRLLDRAVACRDRGDWAGAIALDRSAICLDPGSAMAYGSLAQSLRGGDRLVAACQAWERSIELGFAHTKTEAIARWELGQLRWRLGEHTEAIEQFVQATALHPAIISLQTLDDLSRWLRRRDRAAEAQRLDRAFLRTLVPEVRQLMIQQDWAAAVRWCLRSLQIDPADDAPYNLLFDALKGWGRLEQAQQCFCRLIPPELLAEFVPEPAVAALPLAHQPAAGIEILADWPGPEPYELPEPRSILPDRPVGEFPRLSPLCEPPRRLVAIEGGRAWVDIYNRVIWDRDGALIDGLVIGVDRLIATSDRLPPPVKIDGTVAVIAKQHTANYFHWLVEFLPQVVDFLDYCEKTGQAIDYWYFDGRSLPFQTDSLAALGIAPDRCLFSEHLPHIQADRLWVFDAASLIEGRQRSLQNLRHRLLPQGRSLRTRRLYLARSQSRRVMNQAALQPLLDRWGFETVPEGLSFADQVSLFSEAAVVLGPHGAAFANLVFCAPGTQVLEFFAPSYISHFYWRLTGQLEMNYHYLIGDAVESHADPMLRSLSQSIGFYQDLSIPPDVLEKALTVWLGSELG